MSAPRLAGELTIFAPTNEAFKGVTLPEGAELANLLKYHVVSAKVKAEDIADNGLSATLYEPHRVRFNVYTDPQVSARGQAVVQRRGFSHT